MSGLSHDALIFGVPFAVFLGSLLGSLHCAMMCGPLAVHFGTARSMTYYQAGRMISYTSLGFAAGRLGDSLLLSRSLPWATSAAFVTMIFALVVMAWRSWSNQPVHFPLPRPMTRALNFLFRKTRPFAALTGILTVFLPCGYLYGFVIGAAATGSALRGAIYMFAFWLGTAPAVALSATAVRGFVHRRSLPVRRLSAIAFLAAGLASLASFAGHVYSPSPNGPTGSAQPHCH